MWNNHSFIDFSGLQTSNVTCLETSLDGDVILTANSVILLAGQQDVTVVGQVIYQVLVVYLNTHIIIRKSILG